MDFSRLDFRRTPVTLALLVLIASVEIVCTFYPERREFFYQGLKLGISPYLWLGDVWQPLTTTILHGSLLHAFFNSAWLATFGATLEGRYGPLRFLAIYALLAYVSSLAQFVGLNYYLQGPWAGCVGASGAVYGLFGFVWVGTRFDRQMREECPPAMVQSFVVWFFLCIGLDYLGVMPIANIAHGAGCAFGGLYGMATFDRQRRPLWLALSVLCTVLVLATMFYCPGLRIYEAARALAALQSQ